MPNLGNGLLQCPIQTSSDLALTCNKKPCPIRAVSERLKIRQRELKKFVWKVLYWALIATAAKCLHGSLCLFLNLLTGAKIWRGVLLQIRARSEKFRVDPGWVFSEIPKSLMKYTTRPGQDLAVSSRDMTCSGLEV